MGPTVLNGLPAHVFLVHLVVVFVPVAALMLVLSALWPAARQRFGVMTPVVALFALVMIPLTTHAGEWLLRRVDITQQVVAHVELADGLLPWSIGVFVAAFAVWLLFEKADLVLRTGQPARELVPAGAGRVAPESVRREPTVPAWLRVARVVAVVLALAVSVGSVVEVYRIGDSGAQAAWHDGFSMTPTGGHSTGG